jgi:hypothetical protein
MLALAAASAPPAFPRVESEGSDTCDPSKLASNPSRCGAAHANRTLRRHRPQIRAPGGPGGEGCPAEPAARWLVAEMNERGGKDTVARIE